MGSSNLPAPPPTFPFSKVLESCKSHDVAIIALGELDFCRRSEPREDLDCGHRCILCEELRRDPCFELTEELDCDDRFGFGKDGDDIGERFLRRTSGKLLIELDVDERGVLGPRYDHLSHESDSFCSSLSKGSIFSDTLSESYMEVDSSAGKLECLCNMVLFESFTPTCHAL